MLAGGLSSAVRPAPKLPQDLAQPGSLEGRDTHIVEIVLAVEQRVNILLINDEKHVGAYDVLPLQE